MARVGGDFLDIWLDGSEPGFVSARLIPRRALMLLQAVVRLKDGRLIEAIASPPAEAALAMLDGGPQDFAGSASYAFGGAVLAPYANRVRGRYDPGARTIQTEVAGRRVILPANAGGKARGAETYAMHGLILDRPVEGLSLEHGPGFERATGGIGAEDFGAGWPSRTNLRIAWTLTRARLELHVEAINIGHEAARIGIGWHPYFALPSGRREQARLTVPAASRALVNDYDEVLPTGEVEPVAGTPYDFGQGRALEDLYLDDCFTGLKRDPAGEAACELADPAAGYGLRVACACPQISAVQVYAPPDKAFVVIEPQFNLADPFGAEWGGRGTGMAWLQPGESVEYRAYAEPFTLERVPQKWKPVLRQERAQTLEYRARFNDQTIPSDRIVL